MKNNVIAIDEMNRMVLDGVSSNELIEACSYIDLCACYEPFFYPPKEQVEEWTRVYEPEPTLENTSYYGTELDGTTCFYCGDTCIRVSEHFAPSGKGKSLADVLTDAIRYSARSTPAAQLPAAC